jgi:hypothetical protein
MTRLDTLKTRGLAALWAASIAACGNATLSDPSDPAAGVTIAIAPTDAVLNTGNSLPFGAVVAGTTDLGVTWSVQEGSACGSVSATGLYSAPANAATCHVVVASLADPTKSAAATVTVQVGGPSTPWRPFSASSPWNTPIAASPVLDPNSAALVSAFISSSPYGAHLDVNIPNYSVPLYWADATTPTFPVFAELGGEGWNGYPATLSMPIPAGAAPDPQSDHHLLVISPDRKLEWGCYNMSYSSSASPQWQASLCATSDLTGTGVRVPATQANPWWLAHGPRACGFPLVAGLIRVEEVQAGQINHALVIAYPGILKGKFTPPASTNSAIGAASGGVPCGGRFQYDPTVDVTTLGLSPAGQAIVRALQVYGAYVGDYSGALSLYAENSAAAKAYWANGVLDMYELQNKIDLTRFRVLQIGPLY